MERLDRSMMKRVFVMVVFVSLVSQCNSRCDCFVEHPQEKICSSQFAFAGTILSATRLKEAYRYTVEISGSQLFKGHDLIEDATEILDVYSPHMTGLCGRSNLIPETEYLLSGSYLEGRFVITLCDWVAEWEDVTSNQKEYLETKEYLKHCSVCQGELIGVKAALGRNQMREDLKYPGQVSELWTPYGCFFNPVASHHYSDEDCETSYSYCRISDRGEGCDWEPTPDYEECFYDREADWSKKESPRPAAALTLYNNENSPKECRRLKSKRMKKKCLRRVLRLMKANSDAMGPEEIVQEMMDIRDLLLDDELFDD